MPTNVVTVPASDVSPEASALPLNNQTHYCGACMRTGDVCVCFAREGRGSFVCRIPMGFFIIFFGDNKSMGAGDV